MLLWMMFAVLTAAVLVAVLRPALADVPLQRHAPQSAELAVYKDQLADLDRQLASGTLQASERDAMRQEISRRILRSAGPAEGAPIARTDRLLLTAGRRSQNWTLAVAAFVPIASVGLYIVLGAPGVAGKPFSRSPADLAKASTGELIAKVEARLAAHPEDGRGWDAIAPVYLKLQRYAEAADAFRRAAQLMGETPGRLAGFAEASVFAADGIVTEPARQAYEKLAVLAPERFEPKFWLALAKEQDGRIDEAAKDYRAMLAAAPADATWRELVEQRVASLKPSGDAGPSEADAKAAASMSEADRNAMITGMVDRLAARLKTDGRDVAGWKRLVEAYVVLGQKDKAAAALAEARSALAGDAAARPTLEALGGALEKLP